MVGSTRVGLVELDRLLASLGVEIVPFTSEHAYLARKAFLPYGKGIDKAALNFGDCMTYALAKQTGEPLLFKGNDFNQTDLRLA